MATDTFQPRLGAVTLFAEDLPTTKAFYTDVFGLPVTWEDDVSAVFLFGDTMVNVLQVSEAPDLIAPVTVAGPESGARLQFTIHVADVDATCADLTARGAELVNGPMDRPWGIRTALIADPAGHLWEIATKA
jgi:catechol 2,3-dioxygenase-like lactoylglutathione lyase family enzyme